ncbi:MAG TPA: acyltransferase [Rhizomicrobium sp.]|jgi:peptidoglycan/LPS O-acetylase OafA/YrhL|nr:acyltransferase [Rhizomicrobium sp.]
MASNNTRPVEIRALAGARALPPLLLVLYHYHEGHGYQHFRPFDVFIAKGYLWVEFFFALSGFVLFHVYGTRFAEFWRGRAYADFLKARLSRLYPLHLATLLIMLAMMIVANAFASWGGYYSFYNDPAYHPYATFWSFIGNLFLVQAWHLFPALSWNGVSWFVSVEFFLCLIFPVYLWIGAGRAWRGVLLIAAGWGVLYGLAATSHHGLDITFDFGIVRGAADFAVGVGLAMLYREGVTRGAGNWPAPVWSAIQFAVILWLLYFIYNTGWSHRPADFWIVPPLTVLILAIAFDRGFFAWFLQRKPLLVLGEWSFAIYMGQTTWLQVLHIAEQRLYPHPAPQWAHFIHIAEPSALVVLCTLWGWLLYKVVEHPANMALRRYFARDKTAA